MRITLKLRGSRDNRERTRRHPKSYKPIVTAVTPAATRKKLQMSNGLKIKTFEDFFLLYAIFRK